MAKLVSASGHCSGPALSGPQWLVGRLPGNVQAWSARAVDAASSMVLHRRATTACHTQLLRAYIIFQVVPALEHCRRSWYLVGVAGEHELLRPHPKDSNSRHECILQSMRADGSERWRKEQPS